MYNKFDKKLEELKTMYSKMVYNKICFLLIILLFIINTGCSNTQNTINDTGCNNTQSNINDKKQEYENKEKIGNPYFMKKKRVVIREILHFLTIEIRKMLMLNVFI